MRRLMAGRAFRPVRAAVRRLDTILGDRWLGISSAPSNSDKAHGVHDDATRFVATPHVIIRRMIGMLHLSAEDVCFDIGCGDGRAVCHFARRGVKKVVGVELSRPLAEAAAANARTVRGRLAPIEIRNTDAALEDYRDGTVFFVFNPFGMETMMSVLSRIEATHRPAKREARIVYMNPIMSEALGKIHWLTRESAVTFLNALRIEIYRTSFEKEGQCVGTRS